jgi:autotransporter-associated beta strand protein
VDGQFTFDKDLTVTMNSTGGLEFNHGGWLDVGENLSLRGLSNTNKMLINLDSLGVYVLARYGGTNLASGATDLSGKYTLKYNNDDITVDPLYRNELVNYGALKEILLITLPAGQKVEFWNKDSGGVWNTDGAKNWNSKYDATEFAETWASDSVLGPGNGSRIAVFGTSGVTAGEVRVQGPVAASGLFFLTDGWTVSGGAIRLLDLDPYDTGKSYAVISAQEGNVLINAVLTDGISGAGLHKSGAATVTLNAANTYTGKTLVSAGTLALGNVNAAGGHSEIEVEQGAFLRLAYDGFATAFPQTVTGAGILEITGNVLLDKENTHSGGTRIYNGRLRMTHNDALGSETLIFNNGLLSLANGLDVSNGVALDGGINLVTVAGGESATLSGVITGGRLNKIGAGTLTLSRANDFTGGLYLDQGRVVAGNDTALGHGTVRMANGAILGFSGNHTLKNDFSLNGANFFEATQTDGGTLDGILYGSGDLTKIGNGTLTLGGVNTYTGLTDVREGTLALSPGGRISGQLALHGGTTFDAGGNDVRLTRLDAHWQANYTGNLNTAGGTMTFFLPADVAPGTQPILNVTGTAEIEGSYVALDLGGRQRTDLLPGHVLALIGTNNGISGTPVNSEVTGHLGITRVWRANLWTDQNNLYAGITHIGASDESKALPEGYLAGMALINQGADHAAGSGMSEAANASRRSRANADRGYGYATFGTISGGWSRYNTGSHVDMSSLSLMTGIAVGIGGGDTASDLLTLGVFFEYGNGSYDTHNSFANAAAVHGDGDMYYIGGGILGRMEFADTGPGRFYAEASGRVGRIHNEYDNSDLRDPHTGVKADYDSSSTYYGLHFGAGYVWNITKAASLDLYGKYFWTHQEGDKVTLANGDLVRFKAVDSQRLRLGVRFTCAPDERVTPYIGAAYEHEFDGKARASTYGYSIDAPSLRGDTGIGEFGLSLKPSKDLPLSFDLGVQGYMGQREGVTGSLQARLEF